MAGYFALYVLASFTLTRGLHGENISVCSQPIRSIEYRGNRKVSFSRILTNQNCKSQNEVLLLRLAKMDLKPSYYFRGSLIISAYLGGKDIYDYPENTCFVFFPENLPCFDVSLTDACSKVIFIRMKNIFPITVKYASKYWVLQQFEIEIIYHASNSSVDKTTTVQQMSTTAHPVSTTAEQISTTAQQMSTIAQHSTVLSSISEQIQELSIDRTLVILFGILLFIVSILLFALIARCRKIGQQLQTLQDQKQQSSPNVKAANTSQGNECEHVYSVVSEASNARFEQEVVVNELYNL
ncbi:uncharacterized protein LOC144424280 [Styela clava]